MGVGVAQSLAQAEFKVLLVDLDDEILERAKFQIRDGVRLQAFLKKCAPAASPKAVLERITSSTDYHILEEADFLIENVTEKWEIKRALYREISAICPNHTIFA